MTEWIAENAEWLVPVAALVLDALLDKLPGPYKSIAKKVLGRLKKNA
jgi:hypothetical protein